MKKCIYCKNLTVLETSVVDFCERCGKRVWGDKMYNAIVDNMNEAGKRGDLDQGGSDRF